MIPKEFRAAKKALAKLRKSNTKLTRRRARAAFRSACQAILKMYPPLSHSNPTTKPVCPLCRIPCAGWLALARHLSKHLNTGHAAHQGSLICCPICLKPMNKRQLIGHLSSLARTKKLSGHILKRGFSKLPQFDGHSK